MTFALWLIVFYFMLDLVAIGIFAVTRQEIRFTWKTFILTLITHVSAIVILVEVANRIGQ